MSLNTHKIASGISCDFFSFPHPSRVILAEKKEFAHVVHVYSLANGQASNTADLKISASAIAAVGNVIIYGADNGKHFLFDIKTGEFEAYEPPERAFIDAVDTDDGSRPSSSGSNRFTVDGGAVSGGILKGFGRARVTLGTTPAGLKRRTEMVSLARRGTDNALEKMLGGFGGGSSSARIGGSIPVLEDEEAVGSSGKVKSICVANRDLIIAYEKGLIVWARQIDESEIP